MAKQPPPTPEQLAEQLAQIDQDPQAPADSTVRNVHRDLETLAGELKSRVPADPHEDEPACRETVEEVRSLPLKSETTGHAPHKDSITIPADSVIGQYEIQEKLGEGGMGAVFKARHARLDKTVAVKILPDDRMGHTAALARFEREMKAVGKIEHPHLVRALDAGDADGLHFLVMEYVDGEDLSDLVKERGPLEVSTACALIRQAAMGLQAAHQRGMVHRDIKPANLMLARQEFGPPVVKVLDLGLALLAESEHASSELTTANEVMGTLEYMAPEQASDSHLVDIRVDVYSLGATLYTLLTGRAPYHGPNFTSILQKLYALANEEIPPVQSLRAEVSDELASVIHKMLKKDPNQRYATPADVVEALRPYAFGANLAELLGEDETQDLTAQGGDATLEMDSAEFIGVGQLHNNEDRGYASAASKDSFVAADAHPQSAHDFTHEPPETVLVNREKVVDPTGERRVSARRAVPSSRIIIGAAIAGAAILLATVMFFFQTKDGTIVVTVDDPSGQVSVSIEGQNVVITDKGEMNGKPVVVEPGDKTLVIKSGGLKVTSDTFTMNRGGKVVVDVKLVAGVVKVVRDGNDLGSKALQPSSNEKSPDRRAAEYVLSIGGRIEINEGESVDHASNIPDSPFHLTLVDLSNNKGATDAGLRSFEGCTELLTLDLRATNTTNSGLQFFRECKKLLSLDLMQTRVSDEGMKNFSGISSLKEIYLGKTAIGDLGLSAFGSCRNLEILHLVEANVTDSGLDVFKKCDLLKTIDVSYTQVTDDFLVGVGTDHWKNLASINANGTRVTDVGLVELENCGSLEVLGATNTGLTDKGLSSLSRCRMLVTLDIYGTRITDRGLKHFNGCTKLTFLGLAVTRTGNAGLANFKACKDLEHLILSHTEITSDGLKHFEGCRNLLYLQVDGTSISDEAVSTISQFKMLHKLSATNTKLSAKGIQKIQSAVPNCRIVWDGGVIEPSEGSDREAAEYVLSVGGKVRIAVGDQVRDVTDAKALPEEPFQLTGVWLESMQALDPERLAAFRGCAHLEILFTNETNLTDGDLAHFANCKTIRNLCVAKSRVKGPGLAHFSRCTQLEELNVHGLRKLSAEHLEAFKDCSKLRVIHIDSVNLDDDGLRVFRNWRELSFADVAHTAVGDEGMDVLSRLPKLETVNLSGTAVTDEGLMKLGLVKTLKQVMAGGTKVTPAGIAAFKATRPKVRVDGLADSSMPPDRRAAEWVLSQRGTVWLNGNGDDKRIHDVKQLPKIPFRLTKYELPRGYQVKSADDFRCFRGCRYLENVTIGVAKNCDAIAENFRGSNNIKTLYFFLCDLTDAGLAHFADCKQIEALNLTNCPVTDAGIAQLAGCDNLRILEIPGTKVTNAGMTAFKDCKKLESLSTSFTQVTDEGLANFAGLKTLTSLHLMKTRTTDAGMAHFKACKDLTVMNISGSAVTAKGLLALTGFTKLESVRLLRAPVSTAGAIEFMSRSPEIRDLTLSERKECTDDLLAAFKSHQHITRLELGRCPVTDAALAHFKNSKKLTHFNLGDTNVTGTGFAHCPSADHIYLNDAPVTDEGVKQIAKCKNLRLLHLLNTNITDAALAELAKCEKLFELNLIGTKVTAEGVAKLRAALPKCKVVWKAN